MLLYSLFREQASLLNASVGSLVPSKNRDHLSLTISSLGAGFLVIGKHPHGMLDTADGMANFEGEHQIQHLRPGHSRFLQAIMKERA